VLIEAIIIGNQIIGKYSIVFYIGEKRVRKVGEEDKLDKARIRLGEYLLKERKYDEDRIVNHLVIDENQEIYDIEPRTVKWLLKGGSKKKLID